MAALPGVIARLEIRSSSSLTNGELVARGLVTAVLTWNWFKVQFITNFRAIICQVATYGSLKTKENYKLLALKVVAVAFERWSLTRGSKLVIWLENFLYFEKLVAEKRWDAYQRWSQPEIGL